MIPYLIMAILYLFMAFLTAIDMSAIGFQILPWFNGMVWLRVHFITLGTLTQLIFGIMPLLVAIHYRLPRPNFRWEIWLMLNMGILALLVGIPPINGLLIFAGGTLIFSATLLLIRQLWQMHPASPQQEVTDGGGAGS